MDTSIFDKDWTNEYYKVGDENTCLKSENENQHDKFAVAIMLEERIVGHVPKNLSKIFHQFMRFQIALSNAR